MIQTFFDHNLSEEMDAAIAYEIQKNYISEIEKEKVIQRIRDRVSLNLIIFYDRKINCMFIKIVFKELAKRLQEKEILIEIGAAEMINKDEAAKMNHRKHNHEISKHINPQKHATDRLKKEQDDFLVAKFLQEQEEVLEFVLHMR